MDIEGTSIWNETTCSESRKRTVLSQIFRKLFESFFFVLRQKVVYSPGMRENESSENESRES